MTPQSGIAIGVDPAEEEIEVAAAGSPDRFARAFVILTRAVMEPPSVPSRTLSKGWMRKADCSAIG